MNNKEITDGIRVWKVVNGESKSKNPLRLDLDQDISS